MSSSEFPLSNATNPLNQGFAVNQITDPTLLPKIGGEQTGSSSNLSSSLPVGAVHGLTGRYYNNYNDLGLIRTDATVDFNWGNGSPDAIIGKDNFRVDWTGLVQPLYSETYNFYTQSDDGVRLRINDQLLIDKWQDQSTREYSGSIFLEAGKFYNIDLDYQPPTD
ncbi:MULTISPECIES: PA14 domain-containing protein [unclassified Anabaena]|uniref:PA14 domain-containing protein n=1 Tax=unclassified Anabaena TaxID=2619674 RepID=UPI0014473626|nr:MULTISPECIES: PA14 domain-containing protein [unclassified Anabaena]MTJ09822.1 hypothetical protein [Anabaena sp. UHCC 0204]MTJ53353.1 hypothetical protein [Anabaena sp. UHCC 0253]